MNLVLRILPENLRPCRWSHPHFTDKRKGANVCMNLIPIEGGVCAAKGFQAAGVHCGIRKNRSKNGLGADLQPNRSAPLPVPILKIRYTARPLPSPESIWPMAMAQAIICNSGNANTCNADGVESAANDLRALPPRRWGICCRGRDRCFHRCHRPASAHRAHRSRHACAGCTASAPRAARMPAEAIMTTDTYPKEVRPMPFPWRA